jgi:hypothetical protein
MRTQPLAELREGAKQAIDRAVSDELISTPEVGNHALPHLTALACGLDNLQVLVRAAVLDATLEPHEHAETIADSPASRKPRGSRSSRF